MIRLKLSFTIKILNTCQKLSLAYVIIYNWANVRGKACSNINIFVACGSRTFPNLYIY